MGTLAGLVRACHPEPTLAVTAISTGFAASAGLGARALLVGAAVLSGQLSVGWSNDWLDRARDLAAGRRDKPAAQGGLSGRALGLATLSAAGAAVPLSLALGLLAGLLHLLALASAYAYNLWLKATAVSVLPYVVSFGLLPALIVLARPDRPMPPGWLVAGGALLGAGAHFANVLPDLADDAALGVRGLPHRLGAAGSRTAAVGLLAVASVLFALGPPGPPGTAVLAGLAAVVGLGVVLVTARSASRLPFLLVLVIAGVDVALLVARGGAVG